MALRKHAIGLPGLQSIRRQNSPYWYFCANVDFVTAGAVWSLTGEKLISPLDADWQSRQITTASALVRESFSPGRAADQCR